MIVPLKRPEHHIYGQLDEHMLLEFSAEVRIHPLHQVVSAARGFLAVGSSFGASAAEMRELKEIVKVLELMAHPGVGESRAFLAYAETSETRDGYKLVVPIQERHLRVPLDDFAGSATFVAQVDRVIPDSEEILAIRLIRNSPPLALEREGLREALPDLVGGFRELGVDVSESDFFLRKPAVVLKPIWIYR